MKSFNFNIHDMKIDFNDAKILTKACFQYLMKTCYQWAKDHPLVTSVLLFFYLLYIFFPSLFGVLFYAFPLVICLAILHGGPQFSFENHRYNTKNDNVANARSVCDFTSIDHNNNRDPCLQTRMSKRTFTKVEKNSQSPTSISPNRSDTESQSEEDEANDQEKNKLVVEWTDYDQKNLMDLGSSEIERNKRLESLIAKRRARKMFSMQPRRNNLYSFDQHDQIDHQVMGSIIVSREDIENCDHQPGSAPSVLLPTRNPFDLPYDPHEEKPILTGGSFDEEFFFDEQHRDLLKNHFTLRNNNRDFSLMDEFKDNHHVLPSFFTRPRVISSDNTRITRFRRESGKDFSKCLVCKSWLIHFCLQI